MKTDLVTIRRWYHSDSTVGRLTCGDFECFTLELPFKENKTGQSCIFPGTYSGFKRNSPSNGPCIELADVLGRTYIQIHKGNYTRDITGCILVGDSVRLKDGVPWVGNSELTLREVLKRVENSVSVVISDL